MAQFSIKEHRLLQEISKAEMARRLGVHEHTYSQIEKNPMNAKLIQLIRVCNILGVNIANVDLRCEEGEGL